MMNSGVPWTYRYQYFFNGKNSSSCCTVAAFVRGSLSNNYIPIISYYPSFHRSSASSMNALFADYVEKLQEITSVSLTKPTIVHLFPDTWGYFQQNYGSNPASVPVAVASSGYSGLSGFANNAAGFAQALVALRNQYAPNVLLAYHMSYWGSNDYSPSSESGPYPWDATGPIGDPVKTGNELATFYLGLNAPLDLIFYDTSDIDSGTQCIRQYGDSRSWWNSASYTAYEQLIATVYADTGVHSMLWQTPAGNTLYDTNNNTDHHYQDNKAEYFLLSGNISHITNYKDAGMIGILFQSVNFNGAASCSAYPTAVWDYSGQDPYNPPPIDGNNLVSTTMADDGGFIFSSAKSYLSSPVFWK
jgi:hypothetical protein